MRERERMGGEVDCAGLGLKKQALLHTHLTYHMLHESIGHPMIGNESEQLHGCDGLSIITRPYTVHVLMS